MNPNVTRMNGSPPSSRMRVENSEAYRAALAFHIGAAELTPGRGCRLYRDQMERATFRILILLAEAAAWSGTARARNMIQSAIACCAKASTCVRVLREAGFLEVETYERAVAEIDAVESKLVAHMRATSANPGASIVEAQDRAVADDAVRQDDERPNASSQPRSGATPVGRSPIDNLVQTAAAAVNVRAQLSRRRPQEARRPRPNGGDTLRGS